MKRLALFLSFIAFSLAIRTRDDMKDPKSEADEWELLSSSDGNEVDVDLSV
jgi:hypothetical protein